MVVLTVVLAVIIGTFVLGAIYPEKPVYTLFNVKEMNSSALLITSLSGDSPPVSTTFALVNGVSHPVTSADRDGDGLWNPGEYLMIAGLDLTNATTVDITTDKSVLYSFECPAYKGTPTPTVVPTSTPTPTPTPAPTPSASFSVDTSTPQKAIFTDHSTNATSWIWNFGDGTAGTTQNPVRYYAAGGVYTVTLTVLNDDGVTDSVSQLVTVASAGPTPAPTPTPTPVPTHVPTPTPAPTPVPTSLPGSFTPGILEQYYNNSENWAVEPLGSQYVSQIQFANPLAQTSPPYYYSDMPNWPLIGRDTNFSVRYEGYVKIESDDNYKFYLTVDDDGALFIDNMAVISLGGTPGIEKSGTIGLAAGYHAIRVIAYQTTDEAYVRLEYESSQPRTFVTQLYH
ncbi:MAG: PA14 domain protein [Methanocella sp. PtaU1.Bin125]|nr:MAG: PA14 domain protein [Methanocella sp. PtaU1.Bin125]